MNFSPIITKDDCWQYDFHMDVFWFCGLTFLSLDYHKEKDGYFMNCPNCGMNRCRSKDHRPWAFYCDKCKVPQTPFKNTVVANSKKPAAYHFCMWYLLDNYPNIKHFEICDILNISGLTGSNIKRKVKFAMEHSGKDALIYNHFKDQLKGVFEFREVEIK